LEGNARVISAADYRYRYLSFSRSLEKEDDLTARQGITEKALAWWSEV
jgi:hypothetical protein